MHPKRIAIWLAVLIAAVMSAVAAAATQVNWSDGVTTWHYSADGPHTVLVTMRQIGTQFDTADNTTKVAFADLGGNQEVERASHYETLDLSSYVPSNAKVVKLAVKTIITKGPITGSADVFVFMRTPGSTCCQGPVESPDTPVDFSVSTNVDHLGEAAQSVMLPAGNGIRDFTDNTVVVKDGKVEIAWGYQKQPGDALAFDVYLDGYGT